MKITSVKTYFVRPRWGFVKIETDEGLFGWGEAVLEGHAAAVLACVNEMKDYLVGYDPSNIEGLWSTMYRAGFYRGGGVLMSAISGIDQALWDIKGKFYGAPAYELMGGKVRDNIKVYSWIGGDRPSDTGAMAKGTRNLPYPALPLMREFRELGFGAVIASDCHDGRKLDCGFETARELLEACGFRERYILTDHGFEAVAL